MNIILNGMPEVVNDKNLAELCDRLYDENQMIATACNGVFIPRHQRDTFLLTDNMQIEIVSPMQGG